MELLIPSLVALLLGVAIAFVVLPKYAPFVLVSGSIVALLTALYIHWSQFGTSEYKRATWLYNLRQFTSYILVVVILIGAAVFYALNNSGSTSSFATPALPPMTPPTIGGGVSSLIKSVSSRIKELAN
jgi:hypothetical protein